MTPLLLWKRFCDCHWTHPTLGISLDISRMDFDATFFSHREGSAQAAYRLMDALEAGAIANPDENRRVGHYWLRNPGLAPEPAIRTQIEETLTRIENFSHAVHSGLVHPEKGGKFTDLLVIGIGGSVLGPQFVSHALGNPARDPMRIWFFDNTDPDGMELVLSQIGNRISNTLTVVISKSGGTKETRNGMVEAKIFYKRHGLDFGQHAVAITGWDSELSRTAIEEHWLDQFPMWEWVGGRTSELSAVGLLPAALQGIEIRALLQGARLMDESTRSKMTKENPAMLLALMWFHATEGRGAKDMVILPYKDRLLLFSRYLQQLIMESLGKERDLEGRTVHQGIAVYGNKGSTDQHAYLQQLREGVPNFFVTFIEVLKDQQSPSLEVEPGVSSGDYLNGFLYGTRHALYDKQRQSLTLTLQEISPSSLGALIALYERAVGFYASLIGVNAYHQPGVEAGKKAATAILNLQRLALNHLKQSASQEMTAEEIAAALQQPDQAEAIYHSLNHLAANPGRNIVSRGENPKTKRFRFHTE